MRCPFCNAEDSRVVNSRSAEDGRAIRRRRECVSCGGRFSTYETVENVPLMVIKKSGVREPFNRDKLLSGLMRAFNKREVATEKLEQIVSDTEQEMRNLMEREVTSVAIGEAVMRRLKDFDEVAYIRFASVYRKFTDVESFKNEVLNLRQNNTALS